ncbi:DUF6155 family protein [Methanosarcina vacuolata]|uniref:Uncharacterized protein n=1 Tax=Methanosarcina vacuolata Z-761 TaxID=1434123 RepID=A0A0E3Q5L9_9EURY|nr:DUF6155 family protein [Methanosarcina vacuolata]AKB43999.1 hypothetical protein MSVAZ_1730 [Methanosarcina vacuolata Z-761]
MKKDLDLGWFDLKKALQNTDRKELINIIRDLYRYSEENRRYLLARSINTNAEPGILEAYREVIKNEFFPEKWHGTLRYSVAKKAISDYSKASGDFAGTMELMLFYVENGVEFTCKYGDIDEEFYQEIYSAFEEFCTRLETPEGKTLYAGFRERLLKIRRKTKGMAWGFGDGIKLRVKEIEIFFEDAQSDS